MAGLIQPYDHKLVLGKENRDEDPAMVKIPRRKPDLDMPSFYEVSWLSWRMLAF